MNLKRISRNLKKEFDAYDHPRKVDPKVMELLQKIEESICNFHKPEMELVVCGDFEDY
ncbi:MAG: hypothetical protein ABI543_03370 [Ignavibacteria bacterium]